MAVTETVDCHGVTSAEEIERVEKALRTHIITHDGENLTLSDLMSSAFGDDGDYADRALAIVAPALAHAAILAMDRRASPPAPAEAKGHFNVNNSVRVKLTDEGAAELKRQYDEITSMLHIDRPAWSDPRDADGYCKFQLWDLMNRFGHMMTLGRVMPFAPSIELDATAIRSLASPAPKGET